MNDKGEAWIAPAVSQMFTILDSLDIYDNEGELMLFRDIATEPYTIADLTPRGTAWKIVAHLVQRGWTPPEVLS